MFDRRTRLLEVHRILNSVTAWSIARLCRPPCLILGSPAIPLLEKLPVDTVAITTQTIEWSVGHTLGYHIHLAKRDLFAAPLNTCNRQLRATQYLNNLSNGYFRTIVYLIRPSSNSFTDSKPLSTTLILTDLLQLAEDKMVERLITVESFNPSLSSTKRGNQSFNTEQMLWKRRHSELALINWPKAASFLKTDLKLISVYDSVPHQRVSPSKYHRGEKPRSREYELAV